MFPSYKTIGISNDVKRQTLSRYVNIYRIGMINLVNWVTDF